MKLQIKPQIPPDNELILNNVTDHSVLNEQLESASDDGSDACSGDAYYPINVNTMLLMKQTTPTSWKMMDITIMS